jgi:hypothetical protein
MPERYSPLADGAFIFRLADPGSQFLPMDAELPLPRWFEPSSGDVAEGEKRGRPPGLSVWDKQYATVEDARQLLGRPQSAAFGMSVAGCKLISQTHKREIAVVSDPLDEQAPKLGWEAHALIEGLKRPPGTTRQAHLDLLTELAQSCQKAS